MLNARPTVQDIPEHIMEYMVMEVAKGMAAFYADPENEARYQAWKKEKEARKQ